MYTLLRKTVSVLIITAMVFSPVQVYADVVMPDASGVGNGIVSGTGSIGAVNQDLVHGTATQEITQTSSRMIVNWNSFSIGNGGTVTFNQNAVSSIALNRVTGGSPSNIYGNLTANGRIFLVNTNGILFGPNSSVNTAGLVASTLDITNGDFSDGIYKFSGTGGSVINNGTLSAPGGFVALLGGRVENNNAILASTGSVALASGNAVTLGLDASNIISVAVNTQSGSNPDAASAGVINTGNINAADGKVWITADVLQTAFNNAVNNSGVIEAQNIEITGNGDIELQAGTTVESKVAASADAGVASVLIESTDGNVGISSTSVTSEVTRSGEAHVDVLASGVNSQINIGDSTVSSTLNGTDGMADVTIAAGKYEAYSGDGVDRQSIDGEGRINIYNDTGINATTAGEAEGTRYASINILAQDIDISDSFALAINEDHGRAEINIFAGDYQRVYEYSWGGYYKYFSGGTLNVTDSGILASTADGSGDVGGTHVRLYGHDVTLDGSAVGAQQKADGEAIVDIYAGDIIDYNGEGIRDSFYNTGTLTIQNPVTAFTDDNEYLIVGFLPSVAALVGGNGSAEVDIEGGTVVVDKATILSKVVGDGDALAGIYAGYYEETGEDKDAGDYAEGETFTFYFGAATDNAYSGAGTIDIVNTSSVTAEVGGSGEAEVELYATGDLLQEEPSEEVKRASYPYPTGGITIDHSTVTATASGESTAAAIITMQAGNYSQLKGNVSSDIYNEETLRGGTVNIKNSSAVLANAYNNTSEVNIYARDITVDKSSVTANVTSNYNASVHLRAGEWSDRYDIYSDWEGGDSALYTGSLTVQNGGVVSANAGFGSSAKVSMEAVDIKLDAGTVKTEVGGYGYAEVSMRAGLIHWYMDSVSSNEGGTINILNKSSVLATGADEAVAYDYFYADAINVKDSSVQALLAKGGEVFIGFYPANYPVSSGYVAAKFSIDNSLVNAAITGYGGAGIQFGYNPYTYKYYDTLALDILNGSQVTASVSNGGEASVEVDASRDVTITGTSAKKSTVSAVVTGDGEADLNFNLFGEGNDFKVTNSVLTAQVTGAGHAEVYVYNSENEGYFSESILGNIFDYFSLVTKNGPIYGDITITNSSINAKANSTSEFDWSQLWGGEKNTAVIGMMSTGPISLTNNSQLTASEANHPAFVGLLSDASVSVDGSSKLTATASNSVAGVGILGLGTEETSTNSIDMKGTISVNAGKGVGIVGLLGVADINAAGSISASGNDGVGLVQSLLAEYAPSIPTVTLGLPSDFGSAVLIGSLYGDITLGGKISADLVGVAALTENYRFKEKEMSFSGGNILGTGNGLISADLLLLLAQHNIGTAAKPINTDVDVVAGYSWDEGDIYINEANDIALGLFVPVSVGSVDWGEIKSLMTTDEVDYNFGIGISLAARNGIVHVESQGDMVVNSVIAPLGGVYLKTYKGSIYAGTGWDPSIECGEDCNLAWNFTYLLYNMGMKIDEGTYYLISSAVETLLMDNPFVSDEESDSQSFFLPIMIGSVGEDGSILNDGPNVIAGGYSYFSAPVGTIGVGYPTEKDPAISAQILGVVRPGTTAVTGLNPSVDLDLTQGVPPGLVYYDDNEEYSGGPMDGSTVENDGPDQVWPKVPVVSPVLDNVNPLRVHIDVLPDSKSAVPAGFTPLLSGLTLQIGTLTPEPPQPPEPVNDVAQLVNPLAKSFRAYYEILKNFRVVSIEPMTPTNFFAYHPLSEADSGAFDGVDLDPDAYEFIDGNLNYNGDVGGYLGEGEKK